MDKKIRETVLASQKNEITEHIIYRKLSGAIKDPHNSKVLGSISRDELKHYNFWKKYTGQGIKPNMLKVWKYYLISRILGITFGIKLMESGEESAQVTYGKVSKSIPEAKKVLNDEERHEKQLINMINEERLRYVGSIVLGLNDALVELTGALAGFTLALQNTPLIAMVGLITGIAASLSMGASEYLSTKTEEKGGKEPLKASIYTGGAYVLTVLFLVAPFFVFANPIMALLVTLVNAIIVILIFTFYVSVANELPFRRRFLEMVFISLGVAGLSFLIGFLIKILLGI